MRRYLSLALSVLALLSASPAAHAAWTMAHGDAANTGLARVITAPADRYPTVLQEIGGLGWDAGPVTAADGTVYVATLAGELHAYAHDGTPRWTIPFGAGLWAEASPAIGSDGSIYVVARRIEHDRSRGDSHLQVLHKFSPTGQLLWRRGLPARETPLLRLDQGIAHSAPKLWRHDRSEVVMLGVVHGIRRAEAATLLAFSGATGDLLGNLPLGHDPDDHDITGSSPLSDALDAVLDVLFPGFSNKLPCDWFDCRIHQAWVDRATWRVPEIGIRAASADALPEVVVSSDVGLHMTRGFAFDPTSGYAELWSVEERGRELGSAPMLLSNRIAAVSLLGNKTPSRVDVGGPDGTARPSIAATSVAVPTLTSDGRIAVVAHDGLHVARASGVDERISLEGRTYAPVAASCSHLLVATSRHLLSFDRRTLALEGELPILGGGTTAPAIGPFGDLHHAIQNHAGRTVLMFWPAPDQPVPGTPAARLCSGSGVGLPDVPIEMKP